MIKTIKNGCPICTGNVVGDDEHKYFCEHCNILFSKERVVDKSKPSTSPRPHCIEREKGYLYFIDKKGDISRVKMARSRKEKGPKIHETMLKVGLRKEKGYLYYLDKDGCIARSPMQRKKKKSK